MTSLVYGFGVTLTNGDCSVQPAVRTPRLNETIQISSGSCTQGGNLLDPFWNAFQERHALLCLWKHTGNSFLLFSSSAHTCQHTRALNLSEPAGCKWSLWRVKVGKKKKKRGFSSYQVARYPAGTMINTSLSEEWGELIEWFCQPNKGMVTPPILQKEIKAGMMIAWLCSFFFFFLLIRLLPSLVGTQCWDSVGCGRASNTGNASINACTSCFGTHTHPHRHSYTLTTANKSAFLWYLCKWWDKKSVMPWLQSMSEEPHHRPGGSLGTNFQFFTDSHLLPGSASISNICSGKFEATSEMVIQCFQVALGCRTCVRPASTFRLNICAQTLQTRSDLLQDTDKSNHL